MVPDIGLNRVNAIWQKLATFKAIFLHFGAIYCTILGGCFYLHLLVSWYPKLNDTSESDLILQRFDVSKQNGHGPEPFFNALVEPICTTRFNPCCFLTTLYGSDLNTLSRHKITTNYQKIGVALLIGMKKRIAILKDNPNDCLLN